MKTKLNLTLLAAAAMLSSNVASAQTPLPPPPAGMLPIDGVILQLMTTGTVVGKTPLVPLGGGMDDDQLHGNDGDDTITGDAGNDTLYGGNGADTLHARTTANAITGDGGADIYGEGGADSFHPPVNRGLESDPLGIVGGDGADFLTGSASIVAGRPVCRGLFSDPLGVIVGGGDADFLSGTSAPATNARTAQPAGATSLFTSVQSPYTIVAGPVVNRGIESDPFGINGDEGADTLKARTHPASNGIVGGGADNDSFTGDNMDEDALFQLFTGLRGYSGGDELWGDNGTDSLKK